MALSTWKFFIGSSILGAGLLVKAGAPLVPMALGVAVAAAVTWQRLRSRGGRAH